MTESNALALIKAVEQLADSSDLRDKPNHPLNRIANVLEDIDKTLTGILTLLTYEKGIAPDKLR